ncbi:MAG: alanine racemase, partial [Pseudomonadota bacterium]
KTTGCRTTMADAPDGALANARVLIDQAALVSNYRLLAARAAPARCAATVKADGYGLGVAHIVPPLGDAGCTTFFVATVGEGVAVRALAPAAEIYVLGGHLPDIVPELCKHKLSPVLNTCDAARMWRTVGGDAPAAIHIDTGMNRLGLSPNEVAALQTDADLRGAINISLLMSHLACGDDLDHPMTARQSAAFNTARDLFPEALTSLANSAGTLARSVGERDLARPGIALYGGAALNDVTNEMAPVATLEARVLQVRKDWDEPTVGYGATYDLGGVRRLATLGIGYADGLPRHLSAATGERGAEFYCAGHMAPVVGRVSMDLTTIDVSALPDNAIAPGDWVEVFGPHVALDTQAAHAGTIGYELLVRVAPRVARMVV